MEEKRCFKCGEIKPLSEFYAHPEMGDGHLNKCKECAKNDSRIRSIERRDYIKEYERARATLPHRRFARREYCKSHPEVKAKSNKEYHARYPEKHIAHNKVNNAIRDGIIKKSPCEVCGDFKVEAHHEDYSKPLDVTWLCKKHHLQRHGKRLWAHVPHKQRAAQPIQMGLF